MVLLCDLLNSNLSVRNAFLSISDIVSLGWPLLTDEILKNS